MALVVGSRIGLITYTLGTDPRPGRVEHNAERQLIEANVVIGGQGSEANRPTAGKSRALYWDTGRNVLQWDTGTAWQDISTVGGGGPAINVVTTGNGTEGTSLRGARADHSHFLPLATTTTHGAMSSTDKAFINNATSTATVGRLVVRDTAGRAQFASPVAAADAATKSYVDSTIGGAAAPVVNYESNGLATPVMLYATDEVANANAEAFPDTLVVRDVNGRAQFAYPSIGSDASTKLYVDTQISNHRHDATHITSGTLAAARLPLVSSAANGAMSVADKVKLDNATSVVANNALVLRSATGTIEVGNPALSTDATTKLYVDNGLNAKAASNHTHDAAVLTTGTIAPARLPLATSSTPGAVAPAHYVFLNSPTLDAGGITSGTISPARLPVASSSSTGVISASTYTQIYNHGHDWTSITGKPLTFPPSGHSHSGTDITSGTIPSARLPLASASAAGAMSTSNYNSLVGATWDNIAGSIVERGTDGTFYVTEPTKPENPATKRYVDGKVSRPAYKTNARPMPYGLPEVSELGARSLLFDYLDTDDVPVDARGLRDVLGANVTDVHDIMPLLTTPSDDDGEPERIQDRALLWPVIRAIHEIDVRFGRIEDALGLPLFNPNEVL